MATRTVGKGRRGPDSIPQSDDVEIFQTDLPYRSDMVFLNGCSGYFPEAAFVGSGPSVGCRGRDSSLETYESDSADSLELF